MTTKIPETDEEYRAATVEELKAWVLIAEETNKQVEKLTERIRIIDARGEK